MNYPPVVVIDSSLSMEERVELLLGVLSRDNTNCEQTIEICADIDLTGHTGIEIWDKRSLIAPQSCARGPRSLGPRVFITDERARGRASLFDIHGDNVVVSGFRLEGPTDYIAQGDRKEKGILVSPPATDDKRPLPFIRSIEISNMEIFHWSGVGVQVQDNVREEDLPGGRGRLFNTNPAAVRVKGCYFHHNRHGAGEGYGVNSTGGAYVLIEQNVFDENRHAIAGGSKHRHAEDYSGYTARDNLVLAGGGVHCLEPSARNGGWGGLIGGVVGGLIGGLIGGVPGAAIGAAIGTAVGAGVAAAGLVCWQTHQIDMHGTKSTSLRGQACCGIAGETIIIERNTVLYDGSRTHWWMLPGKGHAIKIRGNPIDKAVADSNVFKHKSRSDAIAQNGEPGFGDNITNPIQVSNNVFDCGDLTAELGRGDFFGDGLEDDFLATGVTWWARSPTTEQWRYLNTMKERLPELQLGKIDGDAIWDVAPRTRQFGTPPEKYSKSGTSAWLPRNVIHP
jgi:hypothetical protein